ncbi:MAG: hypothetical protein M1570_17315 [Chloroflexi bacterium]|nr:hypothetical protein [Chloroflexota bacterium]
MKAKVIFNPAAGNPAESALQLVELLRDLQAQQIESEVMLVQPEMNLSAIARRAVRGGAKWVIVSGGDGTIENVALGLVGSHATLGIIPTGTRNNLAASLGIPTDSIAAAVGLLRMGRRLQVDVGEMRQGRVSRLFLEAGAIGLASALYPSADDIQHGDIGKIGEFIATFLSHTPSEIRLRLDGSRREIVTNAHLVLIANMPYMGANFQIAPDIGFDDHRLDVFVYSNLSKLDLIGQAIQLTTGTSDARIQRYRARTVEIVTNPPMPVMADGVSLGEGPVTTTVRPRGLAVMAGAAQPAPSLDHAAVGAPAEPDA